MLDFRIEWLDAPSVRNEALAATWARLEIVADGKRPSQALVKKSRAVHDGVYTSLFPLCRFIVRNWWSLFHERKKQAGEQGVLHDDLGSSIDWMRRHNLFFSREGMAYPDLSIYREDTEVVLRWDDRRQAANSSVQFIGTDFVRITPADAEHTFGEVVDRVLERIADIEDEDVKEVQQDWMAIRQSAQGERPLCERIAALGLDPYGEGLGLLEDILDEVPFSETILQDLLAATAPANVDVTLDAVARLLRRLVDPCGVLARPADLHGHGCNDHRPYRAGYTRASRVRKVFGISASEPIEDMKATIDAALGVESSVHWSRSDIQSVDGVVQASRQPAFMGTGRKRTAKRFHLARAFHHFLYSTDATTPRRLITRGGDWQQACSRAFAAELLAPAQALSQRAEGISVWSETGNLARMFDVDPMVIAHQISNHDLC